ncbi:MAG TPA: TonB-dependent receptor [Bacteroidales bacterium]|nr:TonB-dependent receptor [Bacteroidales bacterium]
MKRLTVSTSVISLLLFVTLVASAQKVREISGYVTDSLQKPVAGATIYIQELKNGTTSNEKGYFSLTIPQNQRITLSVSSIGFKTTSRTIEAGADLVKISISLSNYVEHIGEVTVISTNERETGLNRINIRDITRLPNPSGNIETFIKTLPGVASNSELSAQYSVRGGSFDENLVYVNDVEIIRPFLIRSGQQEGLSFINSDMVSSVRFSAGGFESRFGDRMSSVLDVSYRRPEKFGVTGSLSLMGGSLTVESITKNKKFSQITGVRYRDSKYLLNSFQTKGEYSPRFVDFQTLLTYKPTTKLEFNFLGNFAQNRYDFVPESRSTNFGTLNDLYSLKIYYAGKEMDRYRSALGSLAVIYRPATHLSLKFMATGYSTSEQETYDIDGQYLINELDNSAESPTYKDSILNIGVGEMLNHARNYLWMDAGTLSHIGLYEKGAHTLRWSVQAKREWVTDRLNEWTYMDSAGYSIPYREQSIIMDELAKAENHITSTRFSGYLQDAIKLSAKDANFYINGGIRFHYWTFNKELLISPRGRIAYQPSWKSNMLFYLAGGVYQQPTLYREMRNTKGEINKDIKAQKSIHLVMGNDYYFQLWERPFKLTTELYYKSLSDLIPYKMDNVRLKYSAQNEAKGYAAGMDMKLNGEFVEGVESWLSISLLKTEEDINGDYYTDRTGNRIEPGYYPRPTDQRFILNLFFQDYLPNSPTLQVHMNFVYGSRISITPTRSPRYDLTFPMGPYRRVDLGFSKTIKKKGLESRSMFRRFDEFILGIEVFNLLNINNKSSYLWVRTVNNQSNEMSEVAVPNYLTSRRINIKCSFSF